MPALLKLQDISYSYPKSSSRALDSVTLDIPVGSFFALLGPNGAGKTTLMRLICGRLQEYSGKLEVTGEFRNPAGFLDPLCYGVLLENPGVYQRLTVGEYLRYFAGFYGIEKKSADAQGKEVLDKLKGPEWNAKLSTLSLGNRQKLQIARALIHKPKVLILDEPVANLDPESREMVWEYIGGWRKTSGGTAIVCSHILAEMEAEATDYAIIDRGKLLRRGSIGGEIEPPSASSRYDMEFPEPVNEDSLRRVLASAGLVPSKIGGHGLSLAEIYKNTVRQ